jgi:hypothetical protein
MGFGPPAVTPGTWCPGGGAKRSDGKRVDRALLHIVDIFHSIAPGNFHGNKERLWADLRLSELFTAPVDFLITRHLPRHTGTGVTAIA